MSKIKNENYYQVSGWMLNELQLKGNELLIYAIIYGFTQSNNCYSGGLSYLEEFTGATKPTVIQVIKNLVAKKLLEKESVKTEKGICNIYQAVKNFDLVKNFNQGGKETLPDEVKNFNQGGKETLPNNNTYNNINTNNTHNNNCVPAYIREPYKNTKSENADLLKTCHNLILEHNARNPVHSISVNKVFEYFKQTYNQGMAISRLNQMASADEIITALKNYLKVANSKTWRSSFSITAFCNSYIDFSADFFSMGKFINMPRDKVKAVNDEITKSIANKHFFRLDTFIYHRNDWFNLGMPEGEELVAIVKTWVEEDEKNNVNYEVVNLNWEEEK